MNDSDSAQETCPVCGAMLAEEDRSCPRCGADVTRDRTLDEPVVARPEGPVPDPERAQGRREDRIEPPEDVDYRERKPSYEAGFRPPVPDDG
jgi:predicted amidophosphoribosyltransferase